VLSGQAWSVGSVLAAAFEARAQAALGHAEATHAALHRAETCLSHLDPGSIGMSAFDYNEAQLRFHEGNAFTHLRDTKAAWQCSRASAVAMSGQRLYGPDYDPAGPATYLAYDGDVTGAVAIMVEAATPLTDQQRQGIITARVRKTIAILPTQYHTLPTVRDLNDLLLPSPETKENS
jgi:hypothetical protein